MIITLYKTAASGKILYYVMHDRQAVLTGHYALFSAWRVGEGAEREKMRIFDTLGERDREIRRIFARKLREGYRLLYSFDRGSVARDPSGRGETGSADGGAGGNAAGSGATGRARRA